MTKHIGRIKWKLFDLLQDAGLDIITPENFWMQQGGFRHHHWGLACWGADWRDDKNHILGSCHSWSTMTECVRYGIAIRLDDPHSWEISSKMTVEESRHEREKAEKKRAAILAKEDKRRRQYKASRRNRFRVYKCNRCPCQWPWEPGGDVDCPACGSSEKHEVDGIL